MTILRNWFNGGADGVAITTANSDDGGGDTLTCTISATSTAKYEDSLFLKSPSSLKMSNSAGTGDVPSADTIILIHGGGTPFSATEASAETWVYIPSGTTWASTIDMLTFRNSGGNVCKGQITSSRKFRVVDAASTLIGEDPTVIPFNTWYRMQIYCKPGVTTSNGTIKAKAGASFGAATWTMTDSTTANVGTTVITNIRAGKLTNTAAMPICYLGGFNAGPGETTFIPDPAAQIATTVTPPESAVVYASAIGTSGTVTWSIVQTAGVAHDPALLTGAVSTWLIPRSLDEDLEYDVTMTDAGGPITETVTIPRYVPGGTTPILVLTASGWQ